MSSPLPTSEMVTAALAGVNDPEIGRPITDLGMVKSVSVGADGLVDVGVYLTVAGCPMRETITSRVTAAVAALPGVTGVRVDLDVMSEDQRKAMQTQLRGGKAEPVIPFAQPASLTRVYAIVSGKGGVGKSSVTVNLAAALAAAGHKVGVVDADIYGHSVPRMLGVTGRPTPVENMIMPPSAHGVKVISIGMFTKGNTPVVWRGPMLHRAMQQFLADVFWGDLDYLLLDLPPGTGDVAISLAQLLPNAELLVVTTPQLAAAEVAERAGAIATQTRQRVAGVIENMSYLLCPHCGEQMDVFGSGGGETVAAALGQLLGTTVPMLGQVPLDVRLREGGDNGTPLVLADPASPGCAAVDQGRRFARQQGARPGGPDAEPQPALIAGRRVLGGLEVEGRLLAVPQGDARSVPVPVPVCLARDRGRHRRGRGGRGGRELIEHRLLLGLVEQVLAHEGLRVQIFEVEVLELGAEPLPQVRLGALGDLPQVAKHPPGLSGHLRQLVRPEDDKRDHGQDQDLGQG